MFKYDIGNGVCVDENGCKFTDTYIKSYLISDVIPLFKRNEREYYRSDCRVGKLYKLLRKQLIPYTPARTKTIGDIVEKFLSETRNVYKKNNRNEIVDGNGNACTNVISMILINSADGDAEKRIIRNNKNVITNLIKDELEVYTEDEEKIKSWIAEQIEPGEKTDFVSLNDLKNRYKSHQDSQSISDRDFMSISKAIFNEKKIKIFDRIQFRNCEKMKAKYNCIYNYKILKYAQKR